MAGIDPFAPLEPLDPKTYATLKGDISAEFEIYSTMACGEEGNFCGEPPIGPIA